MKFWFSFVSAAQRERILSVKQPDVVVQSFSLYLKIIVIFLQTLALSLSWTMRSVNLTAVSPRCFLIQLSCSFFAVSTKTCNSTISLQSQPTICYDAACGNTSPVTKFLMWWYYLFSKPSWCNFKTSSSFNIRISCWCT